MSSAEVLAPGLRRGSVLKNIAVFPLKLKTNRDVRTLKNILSESTKYQTGLELPGSILHLPVLVRLSTSTMF